MTAVKKLYLEEQDSPFANNLQRLMCKNEISEAELARQTKIPQPTLHKILTGKTIDPRGSTLSTIADCFKVSIDELYSGYDLGSRNFAMQKAQSIPLLSWKECLKGKTFISELTANNWDNWITAEFTSPFVFALESKPALGPRFPLNTIFIVNSEILPEDGDLLIVRYPNTDEATLRDFTLDGPTKLLLPIIANTEVTVLTNEIRILGVIAQTRINYKKLL